MGYTTLNQQAARPDAEAENGPHVLDRAQHAVPDQEKDTICVHSLHLCATFQDRIPVQQT